MSEIPPCGIACGGGCGHHFTNGERYVEMLTAGTMPHVVTGEPTDCVLLFCLDCAGKVPA